MRKFVFAGQTLFHKIFDYVTSDRSKSLGYDVILPDNQKANLKFYMNDGNKVIASLTPLDGEAPLIYNGRNLFMKDMISSGHMEFDNADIMHICFAQGRNEYFANGMDDFFEIEALPVFTNDSTQNVRGRMLINEAEIACRLKSLIIGQDEQIDGIVNAVANHLRKINPKKPLVIMLTGPTGVGKTETVRQLANILQNVFGKEKFPLISINCNEYKEAYRISQLLGSPAGYLGHDEPCVMDPIKKTDSPIILLDEFEKAHEDIHTAVMTWLDTGVITFSRIERGQKSAEYNCALGIVFITANIEVTQRDSREYIGFNIVEQKSEIISDDGCRNAMVDIGFRTEIAGRIARFFKFKHLSSEDIAQISVVVIKNIFLEYGYIVDSVSEETQRDIVQNYTVDKYGVRPLENLIEKVISGKLPLDFGRGIHLIVSGTLEDINIYQITNHEKK